MDKNAQIKSNDFSIFFVNQITNESEKKSSK